LLAPACGSEEPSRRLCRDVNQLVGIKYEVGPMKKSWIGGWVLVTLLAVALTWALTTRNNLIHGEAADAPTMSGPHYTVVETEGHNLLVTDNKTDMLYFYTIDKDAKIGSDLKLRGKVDLKQVGGPVIKPTDVNLQK
jgi:hypothetical protein